MAKVYDFDNTVYDGDSSIDFFLFSLKNHKSLIRFFPLQSIGFILMKLKLINKEKGKSAFFSFVKGLKDVDREVLEFWKQSFSKNQTLVYCSKIQYGYNHIGIAGLFIKSS